MAGQDHAGHPGALGAAQHRAQVVGVGDPVEHQQERAPVPGSGRHRSSSGVSSIGVARATTPCGAVGAGQRRRCAAPTRTRPCTRRRAARASISSRMAAASMPSAISSDRTGGGRRSAARGRPGGPRPGRRPGPRAGALPARLPGGRADPGGCTGLPLPPAGAARHRRAARSASGPTRPPRVPVPARPAPPRRRAGRFRRRLALRAAAPSSPGRPSAGRPAVGAAGRRPCRRSPRPGRARPSPSARVAFTLTGAAQHGRQPVGHPVHERGQPWAARPPPCSRR